MSEANPTPETWRDIPGFLGYQVSDRGRARSFQKQGVKGHQGCAWAVGPEPHPLKLQRASGGYFVIRIRDGAGVIRTLRVNVLVLLAFVGPPAAGMVCRHLDGDRQNNCLGNLAWGTSSQNAIDRALHGRCKTAPAAVREIRRLHAAGASQYELAARFGMTQTNVSQIVSGKTWGHLPRLPDEVARGLDARHKLTEEDVREVHRLRALGWTQAAIGRRLGVGQNHISRICRGIRRSRVPVPASIQQPELF